MPPNKEAIIYYLWFKDDLGRKRKTDALKFLQDFKQKEAERKARLQRTSVSLLAQDYLKYSKGVHTAKSQESIRTSLCEFIRIRKPLAKSSKAKC